MELDARSFFGDEHVDDIFKKIDLEIELLQAKLDALRQQKKGMMQQLLTGKIRVKVMK